MKAKDVIENLIIDHEAGIFIFYYFYFFNG